MSTILPGFFRPLGFDPLSLDPILAFSAQSSMLEAGGAAAENLDLVPTLQNLVSGGANASQPTASRQPRAHVPIGGGHLYIPNVSGNYAEGPSVTIGTNETWQGELDMVITSFGNYIRPMGGVTGGWNSGFGLIFYSSGSVRCFSGNKYTASVPSGVTLGTQFNVKYGYDGSELYVNINDTSIVTYAATFFAINETLQLAQQNSITAAGEFSIQKAKLTVGSSVVFDCDFSASNIVQGDTSFQAAVGGTVTINKSGTDPATIIRRNVLRFDGSNDYIGGAFGFFVNTAHAFIKFAVNGDTFSNTSPSTLALYRSDHWLSNAAILYAGNGTTGTSARTYIAATVMSQSGKWNDDNGTIVAEISISDGSHFSKINNASLQTDSRSYSLYSNKFRIGAGSTSGNASIDVEEIYLFDFVLSSDESAKMYEHIE